MWAQGRWAGLLAAAVLSTECYWARSSAQPVPRLTHPSFHRVTQAVQPPFLFAIFGDQKGLAKTGGWDALLRQASALEPPPLFLFDTGDIVENGTYSDQFVQLKEILSVVDGLPYLLAVGSHEIDDDDTAAKGHVVEFLGDVIGRDQFSEERLFYAKTVGPFRLLVLESNDLVYPARGACRERYSTGARGAEQFSWLTEELSHAWDGPTVVAFHHTMILSASKHEGHARCLLNGSYAAHGERTLPEILIDRGVDVVLTGHTHIRSPLPYSGGGREMLSVNVSGTSGGSRLARRVSEPLTDFADRGWDLSGWSGVSQGVFMPPDNIVNQFRDSFGRRVRGPRLCDLPCRRVGAASLSSVT